MAKAKQPQTMAELLKKQKEERKAMEQMIVNQNYAKLMAALKAINPGLKDEQIIELYEAQAAEKKN